MQSAVLIGVVFYLSGGYFLTPPTVFDTVEECSEHLLEEASQTNNKGAVTIVPRQIGKYMYRLDYTKRKYKSSLSDDWHYMDKYCMPIPIPLE
jgi:hypothetical protein